MILLRHASAAALIGAALATPLQADVTADQVWTLLQDALTEPGFALTGTDSRRGDRLVLTGLRLTFDSGEILQLPEITLQEMPDKSVQVLLPPRFPLVLDMPPRPPAPGTLSVSIAAPDLAITVRGLGDQTDFTLTAGSISATLDPVEWPAAADLPKGDLFFALAMADLAGNWQLVMDQTQNSIDGQLSVATAHAELRVDIPSEDVKGDMSMTLSALQATTKAFAPPDALTILQRMEQENTGNFHDLLDLLDRGLMLETSVTIGSATFQADIPSNPDGPVKIDLSVEEGVGRASLDRSGMGFLAGIGPTRTYIQILESGLGLTEMEYSAKEFSEGIRVGFPQPGVVDAPEWGVIYRLVDVTLSENVWDLADPGKLFPRDPVSLVLDLGGTYSVDPKALEPGWVPPRTDGPEPLTAVTIELKEVAAAGLGVTFAGTGSLAFDLVNPVMIDDIILPSGKVGFVTTGVNATIDRLSTLGVITDEDRTAASLALLFIGRIQGGADRLVTDLEFRDGGFFLNGQKIR